MESQQKAAGGGWHKGPDSSSQPLNEEGGALDSEGPLSAIISQQPTAGWHPLLHLTLPLPNRIILCGIDGTHWSSCVPHHGATLPAAYGLMSSRPVASEPLTLPLPADAACNRWSKVP